MSTETITLSISGMTCNHCVANVDKALKAVSGVESVLVTLEPGSAKVTGTADRAALTKAITDAGYEVK